VVFDLDDTLFPERQYVRSGFRAVGRHLRRRKRRGAFEKWMWRRFLAGRRRRMFDALNRHFALGLTPRQISRLVQVYRRHRPAIRPYRGVESLLEALRRRGLKLALLSDGYLPAQRLKLTALRLRRCFDVVLFTEQLGRAAWKPSLRGFVLLQRRLALPHAACAYVADNPAKDFLPPNRLRWLTVQWRRGGQLHARDPAPRGGRAKVIVRSQAQLLGVIGG
jgi:putative hydrolase of the HAD superfamily